MHVRCLSKDGEEDDSCIQAAPLISRRREKSGKSRAGGFPPRHRQQRKKADRSCDQQVEAMMLPFRGPKWPQFFFLNDPQLVAKGVGEKKRRCS